MPLALQKLSDPARAEASEETGSRDWNGDRAPRSVRIALLDRSIAPWLRDVATEASVEAFGNPFQFAGNGGTIPFLSTLSAAFPNAQQVGTGIAGPGTNAHGPNEFLDLDGARKMTHAIARLLAGEGRRDLGFRSAAVFLQRTATAICALSREHYLYLC